MHLNMDVIGRDFLLQTLNSNKKLELYLAKEENVKKTWIFMKPSMK